MAIYKGGIRKPIRKITVVKEFTFEAAHHLPGYKGPCERVHGHTYRLQIGIKDIIDSNTGMVEDFSALKDVVQRNIISHVDHQNLNEVSAPFFPNEQPTAEKMVLWIIDTLSGIYPGLCFVRLYETPTSYAEWYSGGN